jgi:hypothetical protein
MFSEEECTVLKTPFRSCFSNERKYNFRIWENLRQLLKIPRFGMIEGRF